MVLNTELLNVPQGNNAVYTVACFPVTKRNRAGGTRKLTPERIGFSLATVVLSWGGLRDESRGGRQRRRRPSFHRWVCYGRKQRRVNG